MKPSKSLSSILLLAFLGCKTSQTKSTTTLLKSAKWETLATENIKKEELKKGQMLCDRVLSTCNSSYF